VYEDVLYDKNLDIMDSEISAIGDDVAKENIAIESMYTTLSEAKEEIWRRWNDKELRKKVEDYLGEIPEPFKNEPKAALFRFVATPNFEFQLASEFGSMLNLKMIFIEFLNDKFCTRNIDKVHLGKIVFFDKKRENNSSNYDNCKIIDFQKNEGVKFKDLKTLNDESFVDFHHKAFLRKYSDVDIFDVSCFKTNGETAFDVYMKLLPLFIFGNVIFENYFVNTNEDERKFTLNVIYPAFKKVTEIFGVSPIIVPLVSNKEDGNKTWQFYTEELIKI
jgi:hypothetical protein